MNLYLNEPSDPESLWTEAECGFDRNPDFLNLWMGGLWKDEASSVLRPLWMCPHRQVNYNFGRI